VTAASTPARIRAAAARDVAAVLVQGRSLDDVLAGDTEPGSARGLKRSLCYGTLRWHFRLVAILQRLSARPLRDTAPVLQALLEIGLFQLLSGEVAEHAAVAETVNAARELGQQRAAGYVNAVLRRFQRERAALLEAVDGDVAVRTAHPHWFVAELERDWPAAAARILDANNEPPPMWLRVNRRRAALPGYLEQLAAAGYETHTSALAPDAVRIEPPSDVRSLPGFADGLVSVQDAAAQLAVEVLDPRPGELILDACAAPGGKTCHVLERTDAQADLLAIDISATRMVRLHENLQRLGLEARTAVGDVSRPAEWWDGRPFDGVLLDVPCSATGVIRRHPDIKVLRRSGDIAALAASQTAMLEAAWSIVRPGGRLLYTSCSVLKAENQRVIEPFLARHAEASDCTAERVPGWDARSVADRPGYQRWTGDAAMDGFYYACLAKRR
jgi:16S rRNA (cytosine967-C5)-methyltransferase